MNDTALLQLLYDVGAHTSLYKFRLLIALKKHYPNSVSDTDLMRQLGLRSIQALSGTVAALSKNANTLGLKLPDVLTITLAPRRYRLSDAMSRVIDEELKREEL